MDRCVASSRRFRTSWRHVSASPRTTSRRCCHPGRCHVREPDALGGHVHEQGWTGRPTKAGPRRDHPARPGRARREAIEGGHRAPDAIPGVRGVPCEANADRGSTVTIEQENPEESLYRAYGSWRKTVEADLLERLQSDTFPWQSFERLVVDLLHSMGYGGSVSARPPEVRGQPGGAARVQGGVHHHGRFLR